MHGKKFYPIIPLALAMCIPFSLRLQGGDKNFLDDLFSLRKGPREEERVHKVLPLKPDGFFSLRNVNGTISIETWPKNKVEINAVKSTRYGRKRLSWVKIDIESTPSSVSVETVYPRLKNTRVSVSYTIRVPSGVTLEKVSSVNGNVHLSGPFGDVKAETTNGKIICNDASGNIHLSTTNGGIEAFNIRGAMEAKTVNGSLSLEIKELKNDLRASTVNGSIKAQFPGQRQINAYLSVRTVNGRITCDFPLTLQNLRMSKRRIEGRIGDGGPEISLRTVNGSVRLER
ncbi:MAG: DUF4097 domain-containing protein [Candidatus Aminicenantales bacterium]